MSSNIIYNPKKYYTYLIRFLPTNQVYYGVKFSSESNPNEFWVKYKSSSVIIKNLLKIFGESAFKYEVRFVSSSQSRVRRLESRVLRKFNVPKSFIFLNNSVGHNKTYSDYTYKGLMWFHCPITFKNYKLTQYKADIIGNLVTGKSNAIQNVPTKNNSCLVYCYTNGILLTTLKKFTKKYLKPICGANSIKILNSLNDPLPHTPKKFRLNINNGIFNIGWDSRIALPESFVVGIYRSDKFKKDSSDRIKLISKYRIKSAIYLFKNIKTDVTYQGNQYDFNKYSKVSQNDVCSLIKRRQKSAKNWIIYYEDLFIWSNTPKEKYKLKSYTCFNCKKDINGKANLNRWHNFNCKRLPTS